MKEIISGIVSGLLVAVINYYLTHRLLDERLKRELERNRREFKGKIITDLVAVFEDVRINYERIREGKPIDPRFEIRGHETVVLTNILRDLRVQKPLLTKQFYDLMMQQHKAAGTLAQAIRGDEATWQSAIAQWESTREDISKAIEAEFYQ